MKIKYHTCTCMSGKNFVVYERVKKRPVPNQHPPHPFPLKGKWSTPFSIPAIDDKLFTGHHHCMLSLFVENSAKVTPDSLGSYKTKTRLLRYQCIPKLTIFPKNCFSVLQVDLIAILHLKLNFIKKRIDSIQSCKNVSLHNYP